MFSVHREVHNLRAIGSHPNIVPFLGVIQGPGPDDPVRGLIFELCGKATLHELGEILHISTDCWLSVASQVRFRSVVPMVTTAVNAVHEPIVPHDRLMHQGSAQL